VGSEPWVEPIEENDPAVLTALNLLTGRGVWLPSGRYGDCNEMNKKPSPFRGRVRQFAISRLNG